MNSISSVASLSICYTLLGFLFVICAPERVYVEQFPRGSEHLPMPKIILFSIYMGKLKYSHLPLLLESMRWNSQVQFTLINLVEDGSEKDAEEIIQLKERMGVTNFHVEVVYFSNMTAIVKERLGIDVPFAKDWYYKLCDYKPTLAYLFPNLMESGKEPYKFWGYGDLDVIWGNFSRFSYWFQGDIPVVISGWWGTTGALALYVNEEWSRSMFMEDKMYVSLLADKVYHNLDEGGTQVDPNQVVDRGEHSISVIQQRNKTLSAKYNRGKIWKDHCFIDQGDSVEWAGPARWFRGSLQIIHGSPEFPPGRELMFYHRMGSIDFPQQLREDMFEDMITYGYLLPYFTPLLTRYMCRKAGASGFGLTATGSMRTYQPFAQECFGRGGHHKHSIE